MKTIINLLATLLLPWVAAAGPDTTLLTANPVKVTLYPGGAQVTRQASYSLSEGTHTLKFSGLAEGTDPTTLQVKTGNDLTILSVNFRQTIQAADTALFDKRLNDSIELLSNKKRALADELWVISKELLLLEKNRKMGGYKRKLTPAELQASTNFYRSRLSELLTRQTRCEAQIREAELIVSKLDDRLEAGPDNDPHKTNQAEVLVYCPEACNGTITISYFTSKAGWRPVYELRLEGQTGPLRLTRGAKATNSTTEAWDNVRLRFVTSNPRLSGDKPVLKPRFISLKDDRRYESVAEEPLSRGEPPDYWLKNYTGTPATLKGKIVDKDSKEPIPFANIVVEVNGVQFEGATSDIDGNYTIKGLAPGKYTIKTSYVGYQPNIVKGFVVGAGRIEYFTPNMVSSATTLDEVEVIDYKIPLIEKDRTTTGETVTFDGYHSGYTEYTRTDKKKESGLTSRDGETGSIRGTRDQAKVKYIDGIKVIGSSNLPPSAVQQPVLDEEQANEITSDAIRNMPNRSAASVGGVVSTGSGTLNPDGTNFTITGRREGYWEPVEKREVTIARALEAPVTRQYEIDEQLSLPADGVEYRYDLGEDELKVETEYHIVPRLDRRAFTVATVPHWDDLFLSSGDASLYLGDTYIGATRLNADQLTDTAFISLGADPWLNTDRRVVKELSRNEFVGNNTEVARTIEISVRNNGHQAVSAQVEDQIPVSNTRDIKVELTDQGNATLNEKTGALTWKLALDAGETRVLRFSYTLRYPKSYGSWPD